jgi:hypothetical protein
LIEPFNLLHQSPVTFIPSIFPQPNPQPLWEFGHPDQSPSSAAAPGRSSSGQIVSNKNSMVYHLSNCPDYQETAERNRVCFNSEAEAQRDEFRKARKLLVSDTLMNWEKYYPIFVMLVLFITSRK